MTGWCGRALEVDLATEQSTVVPLSENILQHTIGGRSLAGHLLRSRCSELAAPAVVFAVGPFCGAGIQTADRLVAVFRSPLTRGIFDNSSGCDFALALKSAGFDALILKGEATRLSRLEISPKSIRLTSAPELAGLDTQQSLALLQGKPSLVIGLAGENQVRFASVVASAGEPLARGGLGGLLGRMNLKALTASGEKSCSVADPEACHIARADLQRLYHASPFLYGPLGIGACGTPALLDLTQARQMLPTDNFQQTVFADSANFSAAQLKARPGFGSAACPNCFIACRKRDSSGPLPEYDSLAHFSALIGNTDLSLAIRADQICQKLGLDPVSSAVVIASYFQSLEHQVETEQVSELLEQIAGRRGIGAGLAAGCQQLAENSGVSLTAYCCKGLELPGLDPRGAFGLALSLALSTSGEYRHAQAHFHELLRKPVPTDRFSFSGKARILIQSEDAIAACDSLSVCRHTLIAAGLEEYAALLSAVTGVGYNAARLAAVGRQTVLRERWLNQVFGFTASDDLLPQLFFEQDGSTVAGLSIRALCYEDFVAERDRYYRLRGLDQQGHLPVEPEEPV